MKTKKLDDGRLAFLDDEGNVTAIQAHNPRNRKRVAAGKTPAKQPTETPWHTRYNKNGVAFMLPGNWSDHTVKKKLRDLPDDFSYFDNYTELLLEIAARVGSGQTLSQVEKDAAMPPARAILFWEGADPKFKSIMEAARKARAEHHADKVLAIADEVEESTSKSSKVKIDAYRWASEVGDREKYGSQTKHVGDANKPIAFTFATGIDRSADAEKSIIEVEPEKDGAVSEEGSEDRQLLAVDGGEDP